MKSKEDFENEYCKNSDMSLDFYHEHLVTLPCNCQYEECEGWACVCNNPLAIESHKRLYGKGES